MPTDWKDALAALGASGEIPQAEEEKVEAAPAEPEIQKAPLRIYIDRRARRGKEATVIEGFLCDDAMLKEVAAALKKSLGCGGSCREGEILLQGDVRDKCARWLQSRGYKTKMC